MVARETDGVDIPGGRMKRKTPLTFPGGEGLGYKPTRFVRFIIGAENKGENKEAHITKIMVFFQRGLTCKKRIFFDLF